MTAQKIWIVSIIIIIMNYHIDLLLYMKTLAVIAQVCVKQVCCTRGVFLISVIYRAECAFWNCDQTNYVFNYSRLSELRTLLSSPPIWMGEFSQVWEYAVCYRWNCFSKYRRCCNINLFCFKKFHKRIWKKIYIYTIHTQCTTPIRPSPILCSTI